MDLVPLACEDGDQHKIVKLVDELFYAFQLNRGYQVKGKVFVLTIFDNARDTLTGSAIALPYRLLNARFKQYILAGNIDSSNCNRSKQTCS